MAAAWMAEENLHGPGKLRSPGIRHSAAGVDGVGILAIPNQVFDGDATKSQQLRKTAGMSGPAGRLGYVLETIE